jgi:hypothetical protein
MNEHKFKKADTNLLECYSLLNPEVRNTDDQGNSLSYITQNYQHMKQWEVNTEWQILNIQLINS